MNNPLLTNSYACDPYAMEYNGRLYVYMTNDSQQYEATGFAGENNYGKIAGIHIISTDDMVNWTDHGIFQITGKAGVCSYMNSCWAPCATHKTVNGKEKFYIYFTNGGWQLGVVEADSAGNAELSLPLSGITGKHDLYFEFEGNIYNFAKWKCVRT